ncbi:MAG TPA: hypothetical protein VK102_02980 [Sphingobacterium sp.]|nr:hypothetical protein [Sphingobacterium sp.]
MYATLKKYVSNLPGWQSGRKLLVIESDDWGSIRMPSSKAREYLIENGVIRGSHRMNKWDTLASVTDLSELFEVLRQHKDKDRNPAVITPVTITGNPDFDRIKGSDFQHYYYEPFTKTLDRYYGEGNGILEVWKEGMDHGVFRPQFHGREHLNVAEWMRALQRNHKKTRLGFEHRFWGFKLNGNSESPIDSYQAAFDLHNPEDLKIQANSIVEGLKLFESIFGYWATFFVPPNGPFNNSLEEMAAQEGIKYLSKSKIQTEPLGHGKTRKVYHKLGKKNKSGQIYLTRNCIFEPSLEGRDWVDSCLNDINIAYKMYKPAIISTHRVNFIGALEESNRSRGLKQLDRLLSAVTKKWPEVEFISSAQLGDIISNG